MTNLELAGKLQASSARNDDLVGLLWDAGAALRNLHTENTALRVTEDNLRQELQECQDQRRAAFRRIEELDAMLAQPPVKAELLCVCGCEWQWENRSWELVSGPYPSPASAPQAPQQKPLTDEQIDQVGNSVCIAMPTPLDPIPDEVSIAMRQFARAIEAAATEPLLQRIAHLEATASANYGRGHADSHSMLSERIAELERQLEEARNQALEEAANIAERTPKMSAYDSNMAVQDYIAKKLRAEARALKGAKE